VFALFYWLILSDKSPLKNPVKENSVAASGGGRNAIARVGTYPDGSFYWQLLRKRSKKHGPYASAEEAGCAARGKGYRILST
jgi:hypothetical protein